MIPLIKTSFQYIFPKPHGLTRTGPIRMPAQTSQRHPRGKGEGNSSNPERSYRQKAQDNKVTSPDKEGPNEDEAQNKSVMAKASKKNPNKEAAPNKLKTPRKEEEAPDKANISQFNKEELNNSNDSKFKEARDKLGRAKPNRKGPKKGRGHRQDRDTKLKKIGSRLRCGRPEQIKGAGARRVKSHITGQGGARQRHGPRQVRNSKGQQKGAQQGDT